MSNMSLLFSPHKTRISSVSSSSLYFFFFLLSIFLDILSHSSELFAGFKRRQVWVLCLDLFCLWYFIGNGASVRTLTLFSMSLSLVLLQRKCTSTNVLHFKEKNAKRKKNGQVFDKICMFKLCFPLERLIKSSMKGISMLTIFRITVFWIEGEKNNNKQTQICVVLFITTVVTRQTRNFLSCFYL